MEETLQQKKKTGAVASHLEEVACEFASIGSSPSGDKFIGLDLTVEDAISFLLTAMFPYHFGKARERFVETEKRTWELMRAYDALTRCLTCVCENELEASEKRRSISIKREPQGYSNIRY